MKQISVDIDFLNTPVKVKAKNPLYWYDPIKKEMQYFSGGQLSFEYKEDEFLLEMSDDEKLKLRITSNYRMLPKVKDMEVIQYQKVTNEKKINDFLLDFVKNTGSGISVVSRDNKTIIFNVPDEDIDRFIDQLDRNSFRFDI
ncbi:MAG: hypothetical protein J7L15_07670 [Clostridiales bacterium]|nr:hypothetical protein [Clostridiales bacterium]